MASSGQGGAGYQRARAFAHFCGLHVSLLTRPCGERHTDLEWFIESGAEDDVSWGWVDGFQPFTWRRSHFVFTFVHQGLVHRTGPFVVSSPPQGRSPTMRL